MTLASIWAFCLALPGATEEIQWGDHLLFKVGGKMFAITHVEDPAAGMTIKAAPEEFEELVERPGVIPAPCMARAKWVKFERLDAVPRSELQALVKRSYELVRSGLTKKAQAELNKPQASSAAKARARSKANLP